MYRRVPLTNDVEVIGGAPKWWEAFRVSEFVADPAILELSRAGQFTGHLVLYGKTNLSFQLQAADTVDSPPTGWAPFGESTGLMTNSFRIFPDFPTTDEQRYFRAQQE